MDTNTNTDVFETATPLYWQLGLLHLSNRKYQRYLANRWGLQQLTRKYFDEAYRYRILDPHKFLLARIQHGI